MPPVPANLDTSPLARAVRAATERPAVARTRRLLAERGYTAAEWDAAVKALLDEAEWEQRTGVQWVNLSMAEQ